MAELNIETEASFDITTVNYKDVKALSKFISDQGKIIPRRVTGLTSKEQKRVAKLITKIGKSQHFGQYSKCGSHPFFFCYAQCTPNVIFLYILARQKYRSSLKCFFQDMSEVGTNVHIIKSSNTIL